MGLVRAEGYIFKPARQETSEELRIARNEQSEDTRSMVQLTSAISSGGEFTTIAETAGPGTADITPAGFLTVFPTARVLSAVSMAAIATAGTGPVVFEASVWSESEGAWRWRGHLALDTGQTTGETIGYTALEVFCKAGDRLMLRKYRSTAVSSYKFFLSMSFKLPPKAF
jgi:hypothetical protein